MGESFISNHHQPVESQSIMSVHLGIPCDLCGIQCFAGPRYHCLECADFDLCAICYQNRGTIHPVHAFEMIDAPLVPVSPSDLQQDPVPWTPITMDNYYEFSELNGTKSGVEDELVTAWISEDGQKVDKYDASQQGQFWECTICMEGVGADGYGSLVKICTDVASRAHIFHKGCLHSWLMKSNTCPVCRRAEIISRSHGFAENEMVWFC